MKNKILSILMIYILSVPVFQSCTEDFEEMNINPLAYTTGSVEPYYFLSDFFKYGFHNRWFSFERIDQLICNEYAQYTATWWGATNYSYLNLWIEETIWPSYYTRTLRTVYEFEKYANRDEKYNNIYQIVRISAAAITAAMTDLFGDLPVLEASKGYDDVPFDSQKDIYYHILNELGDAVSKIDNVGIISKEEEYDFMFKNDMEKWKKFGNSLRLRYAIRISKRDPEKAKLEGEAALAGGVMDNFDQSARLTTDPNDPGGNSQGYPMLYISGWNSWRMSKTMETILENTSSVVDPREAIWFAPAENITEPGNDYIGLENGIHPVARDSLPASNYSNIYQDGPFFYSDRRFTIMSYAEVCFLKAEAALRGWAGAGDVQTNYENGIRAAMQEATLGSDPIPGADITAYMNGGDVPFNSSGTFEEQLDQIITQKWLGIFPQGYEAWAEFRRTGYPDEITLPEYIDDPSAHNNFIQKLWYPQQAYDFMPDRTSDPSLNEGQGDGLGVKIWWANY